MATLPESPAVEWPYVLRVLRSRPRFWSCLVAGVLTAWLIPQTWVQPWVTRAIIGWNVGAVLYLLLVLNVFLLPEEKALVRSCLPGFCQGYIPSWLM